MQQIDNKASKQETAGRMSQFVYLTEHLTGKPAK
jgi:hypothetical protein